MGMFSFFRDKSELDKSQYGEYFTKDLIWDIVDSSSSMMLFYTKKEGWIGANQVFLGTFGFKDIEEFRSSYDSIRELFLNESEEVFTEDDKSWLDYVKKYKKDGYHLSILSANNELLRINAKCHTAAKGEEFYILELEDITKLHLAKQKTKEVEKLKSKFLANIGHEFRTPMNGILGFVELLDHTGLEEKQEEYVHMINRSSRNLMANIEILLDLSQMQGGRLKVNYSVFSILNEMEEIAYEFYILGQDKGVKLLTFIDPKLPQELNGDLKKIKQIVSSLIDNAIKYTERGGRVMVEVKLLKRLENGDCSIGFSIKDNGKGISEEQIALISEPFTTGNQADERLGVGLSLSHGLVNLLGGELQIQSEKGYGSYFNFVIDFKGSRGQSYKMLVDKKVKVLLLDQNKVDEANFLTIYLRAFAIDVVKSNVLDENVYDGIDILYIIADQHDSSWVEQLSGLTKKAPVVIVLDKTEKLHPKLTYNMEGILRRPLFPSVVAKHLNKMYNIETVEPSADKLTLKDSVTALVVEDNLINQKLIKILLQEYQIKVSTAVNGNEAVNICSKEQFDIVFMDIDMPEKNGIVATKEIKESASLNGETPIVALTAMAMDGDKEMLLKEGLDDYIPKPLTREKLEEILDKYLKDAVK